MILINFVFSLIPLIILTFPLLTENSRAKNLINSWFALPLTGKAAILILIVSLLFISCPSGLSLFFMTAI